jgi:hypothetical protein
MEGTLNKCYLGYDAWLTCSSHAFSTEKQEVMGLLLGRWAEGRESVTLSLANLLPVVGTLLELFHDFIFKCCFYLVICRRKKNNSSIYKQRELLLWLSLPWYSIGAIGKRTELKLVMSNWQQLLSWQNNNQRNLGERCVSRKKERGGGTLLFPPSFIKASLQELPSLFFWNIYTSTFPLLMGKLYVFNFNKPNNRKVSCDWVVPFTSTYHCATKSCGCENSRTVSSNGSRLSRVNFLMFLPGVSSAYIFMLCLCCV